MIKISSTTWQNLTLRQNACKRSKTRCRLYRFDWSARLQFCVISIQFDCRSNLSRHNPCKGFGWVFGWSSLFSASATDGTCVGVWIRVYRKMGEQYMDTGFAETRESKNWLAESLWKILQRWYILSVASTMQTTVRFFWKELFLTSTVIKWEIYPILIKKANQFLCYKIGDVQFPDVLNFDGGSASSEKTIKEIFLKHSLVTCNYFLVDYETKIGRHRFFNSTLGNGHSGIEFSFRKGMSAFLQHQMCN